MAFAYTSFMDDDPGNGGGDVNGGPGPWVFALTADSSTDYAAARTAANAAAFLPFENTATPFSFTSRTRRIPETYDGDYRITRGYWFLEDAASLTVLQFRYWGGSAWGFKTHQVVWATSAPSTGNDMLSWTASSTFEPAGATTPGVTLDISGLIPGSGDLYVGVLTTYDFTNDFSNFSGTGDTGPPWSGAGSAVCQITLS